MQPLRAMRYVALLEATSFLALLLATYVKYHDHAPTGVQILGPIHGTLFLAYVLIAINVRSRAAWSNRATFAVLLGAVVPFGGYAMDRWLTRKQFTHGKRPSGLGERVRALDERRQRTRQRSPSCEAVRLPTATAGPSRPAAPSRRRLPREFALSPSRSLSCDPPGPQRCVAMTEVDYTRGVPDLLIGGIPAIEHAADAMASVACVMAGRGGMLTP